MNNLYTQMDIIDFTDIARKRLVLTPVKHQNLWNIFKKHQQVLWTTEEIDFVNDEKDWKTMSPESQKFILNIIAFFASSDMLVVENLIDQFMGEVKVAECKAFYGLQAYIECIHSETYALMLSKFAPNETERLRLADAVHVIPCIKAKADWVTKYMNPDKPFLERLWAFCIFEGVLFSASFCSIYWLRTKGKCKGLCFSNNLIARDEALHAEFAIEMFNMTEGLEQSIVHNILKEAVELEERFVEQSLPERLDGINKETMKQYVRYCGNRLLKMLHNGKYESIWNDEQPYVFMNMISIDTKTNFFEGRVDLYTKSRVGLDEKSNTFSLTSDF
jgi:ribonucleoside-diphosphate reductase beta chain